MHLPGIKKSRKSTRSFSKSFQLPNFFQVFFIYDYQFYSKQKTRCLGSQFVYILFKSFECGRMQTLPRKKDTVSDETTVKCFRNKLSLHAREAFPENEIMTPFYE